MKRDEKQNVVKERDSNWYVPIEWITFLLIPCIAILAGMMLPVMARFKTTDVGVLYGIGVGTGFVAVLLLFMARLPLYRLRRFWTIGPRMLDQKHRRFYWLAYAFVAVSLVLLLVVWLRTR